MRRFLKRNLQQSCEAFPSSPLLIDDSCSALRNTRRAAVKEKAHRRGISQHTPTSARRQVRLSASLSDVKRRGWRVSSCPAMHLMPSRSPRDETMPHSSKDSGRLQPTRALPLPREGTPPLVSRVCRAELDECSHLGSQPTVQAAAQRETSAALSRFKVSLVYAGRERMDRTLLVSYVGLAARRCPVFRVFDEDADSWCPYYDSLALSPIKGEMNNRQLLPVGEAMNLD